jgi:GT2 family glycosyltransferase/glycosyltransferase involved in cell wall biosynthesis
MTILSRRWLRYFRRSFQIFEDEGFTVFARTAIKALVEVVFHRSYRRWICRYDTLDRKTRQSLQADVTRLQDTPLFSLLMPVATTNAQWLERTISSVQKQLYPRWELCVAIDRSLPQASTEKLHSLARQDDRIRLTNVNDASAWADRANAALALPSGSFVALVDPGDVLAEQALYWVVKELGIHPEADLIFSDEDKIDHKAARLEPWFKPDWNPALMLSCNAFGRLGIYRRSIVARVGGFRVGFAGAEEHELVLRCARTSQIDRIRHIPRILYHRRADASGERPGVDSYDAGRRAVAEHLATQNIAAEVRSGRAGYEIVYPVPSPRPRVSIVMATTARLDLVEPCLKSLVEKTRYDNWDVILMVNERDRQLSERDAFLRDLAKRPNVQVATYADRPFNYSWVNNLGAAKTPAGILCFLNDDTEVIAADWLDVLVARVSLPGVAASSPMLYYPDGTIQHAGVILGVRGVANHACHREPRGSGGYFGRACLEQDVSCVTAACMVIRADVFRMVGGFDEAMPLAYNDVDLCLRLRAAGWRIIWTPAAELLHRESASLGRHSVGARAEQFARDVALMRQRWQSALDVDPFYNVNLSLERGYRLAFPPRLTSKGNAASSGS